jgi:hypothetical protein
MFGESVFMCMHALVGVCIFVYECVYVCLSLYVYASLCISESFCVFLCLPVCIFFSMCLAVSVCFSLRMSVGAIELAAGIMIFCVNKGVRVLGVPDVVCIFNSGTNLSANCLSSNETKFS